MTDTVATESVDDIHRLLEIAELVGITKSEDRARVIDNPGDGDEVQQRNSLAVVHDFPRGISVRIRTVVKFRDAEYVADIAADYSFDSPAEIADPTIREFIERVAFYAVYPFLRESIFNSATRLGRPAPVLAIVRAGDFKLDGSMDDADVRAEFFDRQSEFESDSK